MIEKLGRGLGLVLAVSLIAFGLAACGGGDETTVVETTPSTEASGGEEAASGGAESGGSEAGSEAGGEESGSEVLAGLSTPSGSELLGSKEGSNVVYRHYETSTEPKQVESFYKEELSSAGWTIESSGGSSGGWGSWGGSDYGLTAKRDDEYFDLEAGGEKNSTSYFELCAGPGSRAECEQLSEEENDDSDSGGSAGDEEDSESDSGGS